MMFNSVEQKVSEEKIDWEVKVKIEFPFNWPFRLAAVQTAERIINNKLLNQEVNWKKVYQACKVLREHIFSALYTSEQAKKIDQYYKQFAQGNLQVLDKIYYFDNSNKYLLFGQLLERLRNTGCGLMSLNLRCNQIKDGKMKEISIALVDPSCKLTSLDLGYNQISSAGAKEIAAALVNSNCKLSSLCLNDSRIGAEGAKGMAIALMNPSCQLTYLDFSHNQIETVGAREIVTALKNPNCKLSSLCLGGNQIGDKGGKEVAIALMNLHCQLSSLYLDESEIGDEGVKEIAIALINPNCKLTLLGLDFNSIGDVGAIAMALALMDVNCKLISLNLCYNQIREAGIQKIVIALMDPNCKLTFLDLSYNPIDKVGAYAIALVQKNKCYPCSLNIKLDEQTQSYVEEFNHQWSKAQKLYTFFSHSNKNSQHLSILPPSVTVRCLFPYLYDIFQDELKEQTELKEVPVMKYIEEVIAGKTIKKEKWILVKGEVSTGEFICPQSQVGSTFLASHDHHFFDVLTSQHFIPM